MRVAQIKESWNMEDENLAQNNRLTGLGYNFYWRAIDASLKFNISKRQRILNVNTNKEVGTKKKETNKADRHDKVPDFFKKYRKVMGSKGAHRLPEP